MKRVWVLCLAILLCLTACSSAERHDANTEAKTVRENRELLEKCVERMLSFSEERIYVAMEEKLDEDKKPTGVVRLVSYTNEGATRNEIEDEILQEALETLGLKLIFFQTGSDARRVVIFSYTKEKAVGRQAGFYYSFDALPCGWWGRTAELERQNERYLQMNANGSAWYYTLLLEGPFYYYEKTGELLA